MLLLTDTDVTRCVAAIDLTLSSLQRDTQLARSSRDSVIAEFQDTRRKLVAASIRAATDAAKLLSKP